MTAPGSGPYALHAKVIVFGRKRVFIGSMNLDQRSLHLNAEIGIIIDNPELANQTAAHFADIVENGKPVDYQREPG